MRVSFEPDMLEIAKASEAASEIAMTLDDGTIGDPISAARFVPIEDYDESSTSENNGRGNNRSDDDNKAANKPQTEV